MLRALHYGIKFTLQSLAISAIPGHEMSRLENQTPSIHLLLISYISDVLVEDFLLSVNQTSSDAPRRLE